MVRSCKQNASEKTPKQALLAETNERRPLGQPRTRCTNYIEDLRWNRLGLHPSKIRDVTKDREVWRLISNCCNPHGKGATKEEANKRTKILPLANTHVVHLYNQFIHVFAQLISMPRFKSNIFLSKSA